MRSRSVRASVRRCRGCRVRAITNGAAMYFDIVAIVIAHGTAQHVIDGIVNR
jgi:hypothetical protein